jgi:hypothetical protein
LTLLTGGIDIGVPTFLTLTDTPSTYSGQGGKLVAVKGDATGLEFVDGTDTSGFVSYTADDGKTITQQLRARDNIDLLPIAGYEFTPVTVEASYQFIASVYGNGYFVTFARLNTTTSSSRVYISQDGFSWRLATTITSTIITNLTFGNGRFVALGTRGSSMFVMWSDNGIDWNDVSISNTGFQGLCYGNGQFVAVSTGGTNRIMRSPDGINWTYETAPTTRAWWGVEYGNGVYVAVSNAAFLIYSFDGITWIEVALTLSNWQGVAYGNGIWIVGRTTFSTSYYTSYDGINWTLRTAPVNLSMDRLNLKFGNGLFVTSTDSFSGARLITTEDGINWRVRGTGGVPNPPIYAFAYGDGVFVGLSYADVIYVSGYSQKDSELDVNDVLFRVDEFLKLQNGYNSAVPQYFTHDGAGSYEWVDI